MIVSTIFPPHAIAVQFNKNSLWSPLDFLLTSTSQLEDVLLVFYFVAVFM